jgi:PTS system nitrogen regulatory IIA component
MRLVDILAPELVVPELRGTEKNEILREFAEAFAAVYPQLRTEEIVRVLQEREQGGTTAIGDGIAIPHGRLPGLDRIVAAFGRHPRGVDFQSIDGKPTYLFFVLLLPEDSTGLHLKALARVSRLLKDAEIRRRLIASADAAEIYRVIREADEKL